MKKVLVLEDESNIRSFVVINLKRAGYEAIEAETGEEALAQLRRNPDIKVALLDIMLPDMDGFEVCRRIRASDSQIGTSGIFASVSKPGMKPSGASWIAWISSFTPMKPRIAAMP